MTSVEDGHIIQKWKKFQMLLRLLKIKIYQQREKIDTSLPANYRRVLGMILDKYMDIIKLRTNIDLRIYLRQMEDIDNAIPHLIDFKCQEKVAILKQIEEFGAKQNEIIKASNFFSDYLFKLKVNLLTSQFSQQVQGKYIIELLQKVRQGYLKTLLE